MLSQTTRGQMPDIDVELIMSPTKRARTEGEDTSANLQSLKETDGTEHVWGEAAATNNNTSADVASHLENDEDGGDDGPLFGMPATATSDTATVTSKVTRALSWRAVKPPSTRGAVTKLRSIAQLAALVESAPLQPVRYNHTELVHRGAKSDSTPLQLQAGETVMIVIHQGDDCKYVSEDTAELSRLRVFTLNVSALPPQEYCDLQLTGADEQHSASSASGHAEADAEAEGEEEESLFPPAVRPAATASTNANLSPMSARGGGGGGEQLSDHLSRAADCITQKIAAVLRVDALQYTPNDATKMSSLSFPALVVWRAAGATRGEYPPAPPQTYSSQPTPSPPVPFNAMMAAEGGPIVVKQLSGGLDYVHSLSLFTPVYTLEHLLQTAVKESEAPSSSAGGMSRTLLYLGASWCPPCMRIVHVMPEMLRQDMPSAVHAVVKADMDLAKPLYDAFKVEVIPTFVVLDNNVLREALQRWSSANNGSTSSAIATNMMLADAVSKAEVARLQNSQRTTVKVFVEKHCQTLTFDEDF